jgi:glycosyltransferase involved in cell wall biosynthesis
MAMPDNKRVALFHSNWGVNSQTANAILMLADAGYGVELFVCNDPGYHDYVDFEDLRKRTNVEIHQLRPARQASEELVNARPSFRQLFKSFLRTRFPDTYAFLRHAYYCRSLRRDRAERLLVPGLVKRALTLMAGKEYRCVVGVEKEGLIWAGLVAEQLQIPFFYYNLELYIDDGDYWRVITGDKGDPVAFDCLRIGESMHHARAAGTIIQDPDRARVLFEHNGLDMAKATIFYVPVSVLGGPYRPRSGYLHESLAIPRVQKIILYFGNIWERRYVLELTQAAQGFPDDWTLVMHGEAAVSTMEKIKGMDRRQKVILSQKMVPAERIQEIIASADVGLLFYSGETQNERLTAFASEKMALYMQCGVPFVGFDYPGFRRLADEDRCGVVVSRIEQLPEAIAVILRSHDPFRQNAHRAFGKHYCFADSFAKVVEAINGIDTNTVSRSWRRGCRAEAETASGRAL